MNFRSFRFVFLVLALAALAGAGYVLVLREPESAVPAVPTGSNLLLVTVDTLRADHLPVYGYTGVETPAISRLAREGIVFGQAFTPVPLTLPAHCSLLTGLLPFTHGVRDNGGFHLDGRGRTLAEVFSARGYRTGAFVSAFVLDSRWGIDRGFDHYADGFDVALADLAAMARVQRPAGATWQSARRWLADHASGSFFLWLHFFDPHTPYAPPEPFAAAYASHPYDGEIAYVDSVLGEMFGELESRSLLEKTVFVLASDHGEGLGDHGEDEHGLLIYDSTLRVPWIMRLPGGRAAGTTVERPVSLVDVFPTLVDLFGFDAGERVDGVSRAASIAAPHEKTGEVIYAESLYPRLRFGWSELLTVRNARFKYTRAPRREVFDYRQDPREATNLVGRNAAVATELDRALTSMLQRASAAPPRTSGALDPESERRLRALGYVGGSPPIEPSPGDGPLADPRDKVDAHRRLTTARELLASGSSEEGVAMLDALLDDEPDLEPAHRMLREHWIARGELQRAAAKFRSEIERHPGDVRWLIDLGLTYQAGQRYSEALAVFAEVLAAHPGHVEALKSTGEIHASQGAHAAALEHFSRALEASPGSEELSVRLAQAHFRLGRSADAASILETALRERPRMSGAHYLLAQIAEGRGDAAGAEREYREEIETSPWDHRARFNLALLLGRRQALAEQIALLESIPPLAPAFHDVHFYLAKAYLDTRDPARFGEALSAAARGLQRAPDSPSAPLGHYVMADVYMLQGRQADAARERDRGQALERRLSERTPR